MLSITTQLQPIIPSAVFDSCGTETQTLVADNVAEMEVDHTLPLDDLILDVVTAIETSTQT